MSTEQIAEHAPDPEVAHPERQPETAKPEKAPLVDTRNLPPNSRLAVLGGFLNVVAEGRRAAGERSGRPAPPRIDLHAILRHGRLWNTLAENCRFRGQ